MRRKLPKDQKRSEIIGIKTTEENKKKLQFISEREGRPLSSQINLILENYIQNYMESNKLKWEEYN